ncbi:MAG TPA: glycosyltransferase 87 family protein, partial [Candidatus Dormibacteraeota bacterium]|nr:glycosyltransferase 87 family protein [Candidatus Dormibacteraeota bacterium]
MVWFQAAIAGQHQLDPYSRAQFPYPPVWAALLEGLGQVLGHLGLRESHLAVVDPSYRAFNDFTQSFSETITLPAFNVAFKSILFAFDLGVGLLLLRLGTILGLSPRARTVLFGTWFLNPFVIFESAVFGGFDVLVAFLVLAAVVALLEERWGWAGAAVALGVLTKVSPLFLLPLLGGFALGLHRVRRWPGARELRLIARHPRWLGDLWAELRPLAALRFAAGGALATAVAFGPEVLAGTWRDALHGTLSRAELSIGGFSVFGVRQFKVFSWLPQWSIDHGDLVRSTTTLLTLAAGVAGAFVGLRLARRNPAYGLLAGTLASLCGILLVQPLTQPQYLVWLLPETLAVMVAFGVGRWQAVVF